MRSGQEFRGIGASDAVDGEAEDSILGAELGAIERHRKPRLEAGEIGAVGGAGRICPRISGFDVKSHRVGMLRRPIRPGRDDDGQDVEPDIARREGPEHRLAAQLIPQRSGVAVVHQLVAAHEQTGGAKREHGVVEPAVEQHPGAAQRAVGQRDGDAADDIVGHLVPIQDSLGIRPVVAVDGHAEQQVVGLEVVDLRRGAEGRILQGRDAVHPHAAPENLFRANLARVLALEELGHDGVDGAQQPALPLGESRWRLQVASRVPLGPLRGEDGAEAGELREGGLHARYAGAANDGDFIEPHELDEHGDETLDRRPPPRHRRSPGCGTCSDAATARRGAPPPRRRRTAARGSAASVSGVGATVTRGRSAGSGVGVAVGGAAAGVTSGVGVAAG